jgi:hypothetical protein
LNSEDLQSILKIILIAYSEVFGDFETDEKVDENRRKSKCNRKNMGGLKNNK